MKKITSLLLFLVLILMISVSCKNNDNDLPDPTAEGTVIDVVGNVYKTVKIGDQVWMAENLKTTKYKDATSISYLADSTAWKNSTNGAYCINDTINDICQVLYNWHAVNTGKLAPKGWHVATDADWSTLENYLISAGLNYDGTTKDNKIAKSLASDTIWAVSTVEGNIGKYLLINNISGFSALPCGIRGINTTGQFRNFGMYGYWWTSNECNSETAWTRSLFYNMSGINRINFGKTDGMSVRCVKN